MTRPANPTAAKLTDALDYIRLAWPHMHHPMHAIRYSIGGSNHGPRTSTRRDDADGDHNRDVDPLDVLVSLRGDITIILNGWSRLVMEDYDVTQTLPDGLDVPGMCSFLSRWSLQLAGHEAAGDALDEIRECARNVRAVVEPRPRETMVIGTCPRTLTDDDGHERTCGGTVRAWLNREHDPRCMTCGTVAVVDWWVERMVKPEANALVTTPQLIAIVAYRLGFAPSHDQVRQWATRGKIERAGRDGKGRTLWDHAAVVAALRADPDLMRRVA